MIARKGPDAATINDITDAADVGFGSFYNHFGSKEEIVAVAMEELFQRIGNGLDEAIRSIEDPLEAVTTAIRLFIRTIISKPEWASFMLRVSMVPGFENVGLFPRLFRDLRTVQATGRLHLADPEAATFAAGGALLFMASAMCEGKLPVAGAPERMAAMTLRILGVGENEINTMVAKPVPELSQQMSSLIVGKTA